MKLRTLLSLGYILVFALMVALAAVTYQGFNSLSETAEWVAHTQEVMRIANLTQKQMVDMETGERGFLITGNEKFLESYTDGKKNFKKLIAQLKKTVSDNPKQVKRLEKIDELEDQWLENKSGCIENIKEWLNEDQTN